MRARGEGSLYQRKDGRWVASLPTPEGRVERYARTRAEGARLLAELRRTRDAGALRKRSPTVAAYLDGWLADVRPRLRPSTWRSHEQHVRVHIVPAVGQLRLDRLTVADVDALLGSLALSPRSVSHVRATLRRALADGVRQGQLMRNVAALAAPPRVPDREAPSWSADEVRAFLEQAREDRLHALWLLAATTGMREAELLGLPWENLDLNMGEATIDRVLVRFYGQWSFDEPKTPRSRRRVPLAPAVVADLRRWRAEQAEERLAARAYPYHGLVFTTTSGEPIHGSNLLPRLYHLQDAAGVPRLTFHGLRHTAASLLLARGVSPRLVMELLGHSTIRVTLDVYSHVSADQLRGAVEGLAEGLA